MIKHQRKELTQMGLHYMQQHGNYQKKQTNKQTNKQQNKRPKTFRKKLSRNMNMFNHISKLLKTQLVKTILGDVMASWIALLNCHNEMNNTKINVSWNITGSALIRTKRKQMVEKKSNFTTCLFLHQSTDWGYCSLATLTIKF